MGGRKSFCDHFKWRGKKIDILREGGEDRENGRKDVV